MSFVPTLTFETPIDCSVQDLWDFHASAEALVKLSPPWPRVQVVGEDLAVREGAIHRIRSSVLGPFGFTWVARLHDVRPPHGFTDTAVKSPFREWSHRHEFVEEGSGALLRDTVTYRLPLGFLGAMVDRLFVRVSIQKMFVHRHNVTFLELQSNPAPGSEDQDAGWIE